MSRAKTISEGFKAIALSPAGALGDYTRIELGKAYDAGYLEGSGQSSITALEREVIVAALEWADDAGPFGNDRLIRAVNSLSEALEKAETE